MDRQELVKDFVLSFLAQIGAAVEETDGIYTIAFPTGWKRRFGRERRFTFDAPKIQTHVELVEPGSPFLKLMLLDAKEWGGIGPSVSPKIAPGTLVFTFQFEAYSSVRKRSEFYHAILAPEATEPRIGPGLSDVHFDPLALPCHGRADLDRVRNALPMVLRVIEVVARSFAEESVRESRQGFENAMGSVKQYFQGLKHETFLEEARIRKRLGEIQSKLYFTEDGLRELKLQREQEKLTRDLHQLKLRNTHAEDTLRHDEIGHLDKQRRRHEPKLRVRLAAVTVGCTPTFPFAQGRTTTLAEPVAFRGDEMAPSTPALSPVPTGGTMAL